MRRLTLLLTLLFSCVALSRADDLEKLIRIEKGDLPIIISVPHDGTLPVPGAFERTGFAVDKFVTVRDTGAGDVGIKLAEALNKSMNGKTHLVIALFDRKYIDANRPATDAYESNVAKPIYERYHKALADAKSHVTGQWGRGLLIDIHGQALDRDTIFRGTNDTKTVQHLMDRFGKDALIGPNSVFGVLEAKGYKVSPSAKSTDKENARFGGGFIVQTYGSREGGTVDAIQLELGGSLRSRAKSAAFAEHLAEAVKAYAKEYLPEKPIKP